MKTLVFAPAAYNLAEVTRMLEIAKACRGKFNILFISYGGDFEKHILEEKFDVRKMEPRMTPEKIEHVYKVDKGEKAGAFFTRDELRARVNSEIAFFEEIQPAAVITGFCLSLPISARAAKVPLVWVIQGTWIEPYYEAGLGTWPDLLDFAILRWIPERVQNRWARFFPAMTKFMVIPFNKVAREFGVPPFANLQGFLDGNYTMLAEPPEFTGLENLPERYHFIGPLLGRLNMDIPQEILDLPKDQPIIYFAMGSSGTPEIIARIITGFRGKPYRVVAPVKAHIEKLDVDIPDNVLVTGWLPADKVNPMADLSVIHGGVGTVMTACLSGTPVVGVAMQPEQEANLECLVRKGFAIRIKKKRVTPERVLDAIDRLLDDEEAHRKAKEFQAIIEKWDGPANAAKFLVGTFAS